MSTSFTPRSDSARSDFLGLSRPVAVLLCWASILCFVGGVSSARAQSISVSGPSQGSVGELLEFTASANGCTPAAGGWTWFTDGGQIAGPAGIPSIEVSWNTAGTKGLSALNFNCGGAQGTAVVEISDSGRIEMTLAEISIAENAANLTLAARRTGGSAGEVSVQFATTGESALAGEDFATAIGELSWQAGTTGDRFFTIQLFDDLEFEGDETFVVELRSPQGGAQLGAVRETRVTLLEDDPPPGDEVQFTAATFSFSEEEQFATVSVSRSSALAGEISVDFSTAPFTATAGEDYVSTSETLTWGAGDTTDRLVQIPLLGDAVVEGEEIVDLLLSNPSAGAFLGDPDFAELLLVDDDAAAGSVQFETSQQVVFEGAGNVTFQVTRTGGSAGDIEVQVERVGGTASEGDAALVTDVVAWPAGDTAPRSVEILVTDDSELESVETVILELQSPSGGAVLGSLPTATLSIVDDDTAGNSVLSFATASLSREESSEQVAVTVLRSGDLQGSASVSVETRDASATAGLDYQAVATTVAWQAGDGSPRTVQIPLFDDALVEGDEDFLVVLTDLVGADLGAPSSTRVSLIDDDVALSTLSLAQEQLSVGEGDGMLIARIERSGDLTLAANVRLTTVSGTAQSGSDFTAVDQLVQWPAGDGATREVPIGVLDDSAVEGDETFGLELRSPTNAMLGTPSAATVEILDDDVAPGGTVAFVASEFSAVESAGQLIVQLRRSGGDGGAAAALIELVAGTAELGSDFQLPAVLQVDWANGESGTREIAIPLLDDALAEGTEFLQARLVAVSGADLGSVRVATLNILDDESAGVCPDLPDALCLNDQRFSVEATWQTPDGAGGSAAPVALTSDSGYFWFFADSNVELVVKVLDGCSQNQRFWVFATGLTDVAVELEVTDRETGLRRRYLNQQSEAFQPILDIEAFDSCAPSSRSVGRSTAAVGWPSSAPAELSVPSVAGECAPTAPDGALCLSAGRFEVVIEWATAGASGIGQPSQLTSDTGTFWFFDPDNIELVLKVLDGCFINQRYWVFAGGLTDVATRLTVTDTTSGEEIVYETALGEPFPPILDTSAFATCP